MGLAAFMAMHTGAETDFLSLRTAHVGLLTYAFRRILSANAPLRPSLLPITGTPMTRFRNPFSTDEAALRNHSY